MRTGDGGAGTGRFAREGAAQPAVPREHARRSRRWYLLLVLPFIGLLYPPLYAKDAPELFGFPFFYWYQFAWVPVAAAVTWLVYTRTRR